MILLSLDPGILATGWAVLEDGALRDWGELRPDDAKASVPARISSLCLELEARLGEFKPDMILLEWNSGKVNVNRHKGGGAGLAVHGEVTGSLWREAVHWARRRADAKVVPIDENAWTRGVSKDARALAVKGLYPQLPNPESDTGLHVHDAVGLAVWYLRERAVRSHDLEG